MNQETSETMTERVVEALIGRHGDDQQRIAQTGIEWLDLLLRKNADYGSAVWNPPVLCPTMDAKSAILVRMSDKIQRIESLMKSKANGEGPLVKDESIDDTLRDLGAYCLLYLAAPSNTKDEGTP